MSNPAKPSISVRPSMGMLSLMEDPSFCKDIARSEESLMLLINQLQRDIICESNATTVGLSILALKNLQDVMLVVAAKGNVFISEENKITNV